MYLLIKETSFVLGLKLAYSFLESTIFVRIVEDAFTKLPTSKRFCPTFPSIVALICVYSTSSVACFILALLAFTTA